MNDRTEPSLANPGTPEAIADQMKLILHAKRCVIDPSTADEQCAERRCSGMKSILHHRKLCARGECCLVEGCFQTRQLEKHYRDCTSCAAVASRKDQKTERPPLIEAAARKIKLFIQLLEFVLHILKCQSERPKTRMGDCGLKNCEDLEDALLHKANCKNTHFCAYANCQTTDHVFRHWKKCESNCSLCDPVRASANLTFTAAYLVRRKLRDEYLTSQHVEHVLHFLGCLGQGPSLCPRQNCKSMEDLFPHMQACEEEKCPVPQCSSSRRIVKHWKSCPHPGCPICSAEPRNQRDPPEDAAELEPSLNLLRASALPRVYPEKMTPPTLVLEGDWNHLLLRLLSMLHAHKCAMRSKLRASELELYPCARGSCVNVLKVYHHVLTCKNYERCTKEEACYQTRCVIHHARTCADRTCEYCLAFLDVVVRIVAKV